jgi:3-phosphoshikimate 1-carboxyvinyltransferase
VLNIPFHFTGLSTLKIKETDRIEALKKEVRKLGYIITDLNDSELRWDGDRCEPDENPVIDTYEDHRMALAFAPACMRIPGLRINEPKVVSKSYPDFWEHLKSVGFVIKD